MSQEVLDKAHHSIMLMTGTRKQVCCPMCGSQEYYRKHVYDRCDTVYDDSHVVEGHVWHSHSDQVCDDCDLYEEC